MAKSKAEPAAEPTPVPVAEPTPTATPADPTPPPAAKKWKVGGVKGMPELVVEADDQKAAAKRYVESLKLSSAARPSVKPAE